MNTRRPKSIEWLERETGAQIPYEPETPGATRHLSVRLPAGLAAALEEMAADRGVSVSSLVRELIIAAVEQRGELASLDDRALTDRLVAEVEEVRRRLVR